MRPTSTTQRPFHDISLIEKNKCHRVENFNNPIFKKSTYVFTDKEM